MIFTVYNVRGKVQDSGENLTKLCRDNDLPTPKVVGHLLGEGKDEYVYNGILITASGRSESGIT